MPFPDNAWLDSHFAAETLDEALEHLNALIERHPDHVELYRLRARFWDELHYTADAAADWERIIALDPRDHDTRLRLALLEVSRPHRLVPDDDWDEDDESGNGADGMKDEEDEASEISGFGEADGDEEASGPDPEDEVRERGVARLRALLADHALERERVLEAIEGLRGWGWNPWLMLELIQHGLARWPSDGELQREQALLWLSLAGHGGDEGDRVPVGYAVDVVGDVFHPASAAMGLAYCDALPDALLDETLLEHRANVLAQLEDYPAAARDYRAAAGRIAAALNAVEDDETRESLSAKRDALEQDAQACDRGAKGVIAARQRGMEEMMGQLASLRDRLSNLKPYTDLPPDETPAPEPDLGEIGESMEQYIEAISEDPAQDPAYVDEALGRVPGLAASIVRATEETPYGWQGLDRLQLYDRAGADAPLYEQARQDFTALGFTSCGWFEATGISTRIGRAAVLDLLLSGDGETLATFYVLSGRRGPEFVTAFESGESLTHAGVRGRLASVWPRPFLQVQTPPEMSLADIWRLHQGAVAVRRAHGDRPLTLTPASATALLDRLREGRVSERMRRGVTDLELRGWLTGHYAVAGAALRAEVDRLLAAKHGSGALH